MFPKEVVVKYISLNRSHEFKLKRKVIRHTAVNTEQTAKPESKEEKVEIEEKDYKPKQPDNLQMKEDEKLLKALKTFNGNSKELFKNIKIATNKHTSLKILLNMISGMAGNLEYFLDSWYSDEVLRESLLKYIENKFMFSKQSIIEETTIRVVLEIQKHFDAISPSIISTLKLTVDQFKNLRNMLRLQVGSIENKVLLRIFFGDHSILFPSLTSYDTMQSRKNKGVLLVEDPQDFFDKKLNGSKVQLHYYAVNFDGEERKKLSKEDLLNSKRKKSTKSINFAKQNIAKLDYNSLKIHEKEMDELKQLLLINTLERTLVTTDLQYVFARHLHP